MRKFDKGFIALLGVILLLAAICGPRFFGQQATVHGDLVSWASSTSSGVTGYYVYRAPQVSGSCSGVTNFTLIATVGTVTSYNDPASGLSTSTGYCYEVDAFEPDSLDSSMTNSSGPSPVASVTTPSSWPTNPTPPSSCTVTTQ